MNKFNVGDQVYFFRRKYLTVEKGPVESIERMRFGKIEYAIGNHIPTKGIPEEDVFATLEELLFMIPKIIKENILVRMHSEVDSETRSKINFDMWKIFSDIEKHSNNNYLKYVTMINELEKQIKNKDNEPGLTFENDEIEF